jgi:uroporphyrin-3 C-methyltransferase
MNNNLLPETTDILPEAGAGNGRKLPLSWRSPLALVIAILAVLLIWQWLDGRARIQDLREELAHRLAENDVVVRDSRVLAKQNQDTVSALQTRVAVLENGFSEAQGQQLALESMYQELSRSRDERLLAEIEQTITIAAQQLQLAGNVEAALIALNGADARLARAAQPQFLPLRKLIARDIGNLTATQCHGESCGRDEVVGVELRHVHINFDFCVYCFVSAHSFSPGSNPRNLTNLGNRRLYVPSWFCVTASASTSTT